jgi:hypothetical protein
MNPAIGIIDGACNKTERVCSKCGKLFMSDGLRRCPACQFATRGMANVNLQSGERRRGKRENE